MKPDSTIMWVGTVRALPLSEQLRVAAACACDALSISPHSYTRWLSEGISTSEMLTMASDSGIKLAHLDPYARWLTHWRVSDLDPARFPPGFRGFAEDDFFRIADALKVESMSAIVSCTREHAPFDKVVEGFARTCDRAAEFGMRCDLEFIPFWGLPNLRMALAVLKSANRPNSGIVFDVWHYLRGEPDPTLLESIPGEMISSVQLCDAHEPRPSDRSMVDDCLFHRLAPGDGDFPIVDLLKQLARIGGLNRVGPEIFSSELDKLSGDEIAARCQQSLRRVFETAGISHRFLK
jgi:sugar phosphate isomerase/epimerase